MYVIVGAFRDGMRLETKIHKRLRKYQQVTRVSRKPDA
jgi:preprotein translocase subunit Sss1